MSNCRNKDREQKKLMQSNIGKCCDKALHNETICKDCLDDAEMWATMHSLTIFNTKINEREK